VAGFFLYPERLNWWEPTPEQRHPFDSAATAHPVPKDRFSDQAERLWRSHSFGRRMGGGFAQREHLNFMLFNAKQLIPPKMAALILNQF